MSTPSENPSALENDIWLSEEFDVASKNGRERYFRMQEQIEAFKTIAMAISADTNEDVVVNTICSQTQQLMHAERTTLFLVRSNGKKQWLETKIAQNTERFRVEFGQGIAGHVAATRTKINIKDVYRDRRFDPSFDKKSGFKTTSCLCAPIFIRDKLIGVIEILNRYSGYFTLDDEDVLTSICSQLGVSLSQHQYYVSLLNSNAELEEARSALDQRNKELRMLYEMERVGATARDFVDFIDLLMTRCLDTFNAQYAAIAFNDPASQTTLKLFEKHARQGTEQTVIQRTTSRRSMFLKTALEVKSPISIDVKTHPTLAEQSFVEFKVKLNALMLIGLRHANAEFGALILGRAVSPLREFSPNDANLATLIANNLASMIAAQFEREINEKQRRLSSIGQMMASLMHDMKTPLANIMGYVELMARPDLSDEKRAAFAGTVERQIEKLKSMSADILQFSRGESTILIQPTKLDSIIEQSIESMRREAEAHQIKLDADLRCHIEVGCDDVKMERAIANLIKNAIEALGNGGHIAVSSYADDHYAYIRIEDDGPGIPEAIRDKLFESFVTYGKKGGTGLGLAIVKSTVDMHHGKITCQAVSPRGTAFVIALPR